jgi:hypothetical protein
LKRNKDHFVQILGILTEVFLPELKNLSRDKLPTGVRISIENDPEFTEDEEFFSVEIELFAKINTELPASEENEYLQRAIDFVVIMAVNEVKSFQELRFFPSFIHEEDSLEINRERKFFYAEDIKNPDTIEAIARWINNGELLIDYFFEKT